MPALLLHEIVSTPVSMSIMRRDVKVVSVDLHLGLNGPTRTRQQVIWQRRQQSIELHRIRCGLLTLTKAELS